MNDKKHIPSKNTYMITCIVQRGSGDKVSKTAIEAGAGGTTTFFARGTGTREKLGLLGLAIVPEKEVIFVLCSEEECSRVFDAIVKAAKLDVPGMGIAYVTPVIKVTGGNF
jgi:nitrogen regulatory protein PII